MKTQLSDLGGLLPVIRTQGPSKIIKNYRTVLFLLKGDSSHIAPDAILRVTYVQENLHPDALIPNTLKSKEFICFMHIHAVIWQASNKIYSPQCRGRELLRCSLWLLLPSWRKHGIWMTSVLDTICNICFIPKEYILFSTLNCELATWNLKPSIFRFYIPHRIDTHAQDVGGFQTMPASTTSCTEKNWT